jgi:molybdopterin biosynthesis enzyme
MTRPARSLTSLDALLDRLLPALSPVAPLRVTSEAALGAILAQAIAAPGPVPASAVARRAGWAIAASDAVGASGYAPTFAMTAPGAVEAGAALPPGLDAVLDSGDLSREGAVPEILAAVAPGEGVRRAGEDAAPGAVLRAPGELVRGLDVALMRALGIVDVAVRRPRVAILAPTARAAAALVIAELVRVAEVIESDGATWPLEGDLVLGLGEDAARTGLAHLHRHDGVLAHGVAIAPGAGTACGLIGGRPVILLPSRLEDAFGGYHLLVGPCLDRLRGATPRAPDVDGPLTAKLSSAIGLTEIALLRREGGGFRPLAVGDLAWSALAHADAWTAVPPGMEGYAPGETIAAFALDSRS